MIEKQKHFGYANRFFVGEVLEDEDDRDYIIEMIRKEHPYKQIAQTKLLFRYPLMAGL